MPFSQIWIRWVVDITFLSKNNPCRSCLICFIYRRKRKWLETNKVESSCDFWKWHIKPGATYLIKQFIWFRCNGSIKHEATDPIDLDIRVQENLEMKILHTLTGINSKFIFQVCGNDKLRATVLISFCSIIEPEWQYARCNYQKFVYRHQRKTI